MYSTANGMNNFFKEMIEVCFLEDLYSNINNLYDFIDDDSNWKFKDVTINSLSSEFIWDLKGKPEKVVIIMENYRDAIAYSIADSKKKPRNMTPSEYANCYIETYKFVMDEDTKLPFPDSWDAFSEKYKSFNCFEMLELVINNVRENFEEREEEELCDIVSEDDDNYLKTESDFMLACLKTLRNYDITNGKNTNYEEYSKIYEDGYVYNEKDASEKEKEYLEMFLDEFKMFAEYKEDDEEDEYDNYTFIFESLFTYRDFTSTFMYDEDFAFLEDAEITYDEVDEEDIER